jgi:hypothetical protein
VACGPARLLLKAVNTLGASHFQPVLRPTVAALDDRGAGLPTGTPWAQALGVGRQCGCPRRRQGLADQRRPRPFRVGWPPPWTRFRAAACGPPRAPKRGRVAIEMALARAWPSGGRWSRVYPLAARRMVPTLVLGHPPPGAQSCRPGLAQQVLARASGADRATWRGAVPSRVAAADMALDVLPGEVLPGRHQGRAIRCVGAWPLPHHGTLQDTGPTSAYPGHDPWLWLLRASSSPTACGGRLLREVTTSQRAAGGYAVPRSHGWPPEGGAIHRVSRQGTPVRTSGGRCLILCHVGSSVSASGAGSHSRWLGTPVLALPIEACSTGYPD